MRKKPDLSIPDRQAYDRAYERREDAILRSIEKLEDRNRITEDDAERTANRARIAALEDELDRHAQKRVAFIAGRHAINPPTHEQLERLGGNLEEVELLTANHRIVDQIVALAHDNGRTFEAIHPGNQ
ncbi:MAG: hypothetical protein RLO51_01305 [Thalassobaculum sp.]|uniref:hypothetical protein n=1 Tax=Thalassobaculum sp. TaxID=2022740 RepID=UPI0032EFE08C